MILGLDASTSCCGWALYNGVEILDAGFIDISKIETNKEKAFHILKTLIPLPLMGQLTEVKLEAALSGFMGGRTSQQVIIKLARFNAVLEYILGQQLKVPVILVGASTARKKVLGKAFIKGMTAKEYVKVKLIELYPYVKKFEKLNRNGNWDSHNSDMYDAVICSLFE